MFNAKLNPETGFDVYTGTVLIGVSWFCEVSSTVELSGLKAANKFTLRIPVDADFSNKTYLDPIAYLTGDPSKNFTLQNGDIIVRGTASEINPQPGALKKKYSEVVTVLGVTDNRRAQSPHWKVVGA